MKKFNVGIIGNGYVGESQAFAFSPTCNVKMYDIDPLKSTNTLNEVLNSDFVFVCVPTPMNKDGSQDRSFINDVFSKSKNGPIYVIKSTVLPGTTKELQSKFPNIDIIYNQLNEINLTIKDKIKDNQTDKYQNQSISKN